MRAGTRKNEMPELWKRGDPARKGMGPKSEGPRQDVRLLREEVPRIRNEEVRDRKSGSAFLISPLFFWTDLSEKQPNLVLVVVRQ